MAKCMNNNCDNELTGKQRTYCSDRCRKTVSRTAKPDKTEVQVGQMSGLEPSRTQPGQTVTPEGSKPEVPANYGLEDCECRQCQVNRRSKKLIINHGKYKDCSQLADNEVNRVSLPGDVDYKQQAGFGVLESIA